MSDDARLICSPVVWDAAIPPARWPGRKPRFTVDAGFYLAAFRGELGHLVNVGRRHARLAGGGGQSLASREMASPTVGELWQTAHALRQYHGSFTGAIKGRAIAGDEVGAEFLLGSSRLVSHLAAEMLGRSAADFADVFAATGILEFCEAVLEVSPPIAFDFSKPPVPAVATPEPPTTTEAPAEVVSIEVSPVAPAERPKTKAKPRGRYDSVDAEATKFLSADPQLTNIQIAAMIGCHPRTLSGKKRDKKTGEMVPRCPRFLAARQTLKDRRLDYQSAYANQDGGRHRG